MGRHLSPRYGQVILVSGYPVLTAVNWSKHWCPIRVHDQFSCAPKLAGTYKIEHCSPSSKIINWSADSFQINHVALTIFHEYGALSHARFGRAGAPLIKQTKHIFLSYNFSIKEKPVNVPGGGFSILLDAKSMQKPFTLLVYQRRSKWASACQRENHIDITQINYRTSKIKQFHRVFQKFVPIVNCILSQSI